MRTTRRLWLILVVTSLATLAAGEDGPSSLREKRSAGQQPPAPLYQDDEEAALEEYKRAPVMGFHGMRGKKAPTMGFLGMRGKKDDSADYWEDEKRAPNSGFFGMRGKKAPSTSSFFGMRGKKAPNSGFFGMRGKKTPSGFIGMRGKKDDFQDIDSLLDYLRASDPRLAEGNEDFMEFKDSRVKRFAPYYFQETSSDQDFL